MSQTQCVMIIYILKNNARYRFRFVILVIKKKVERRARNYRTLKHY